MKKALERFDWAAVLVHLPDHGEESLKKLLTDITRTGVLIRVFLPSESIEKRRAQFIEELTKFVGGTGVDGADRYLKHHLLQVEITEAALRVIDTTLSSDAFSSFSESHQAWSVLEWASDEMLDVHRQSMEGHYLDPKKTADEVQRSHARQMIGLLFEPARHALINRRELNNDPETNRKFLDILDSAGSRIVFSFGLSSHGVAGDDVLDEDERTKHYLEVKPLLEQLLGNAGDETPVPLTPQTAYYLLQLMNGILDLDPVNVLGFASAVCAGGSIFGFELDASARDEAVKLVDRALADHKDTLKSSAASVGHMLDLFVKAGWSEALALTFRLDEAFR